MCDAIRDLHRAGGVRDLVIVPVGFLSDHLEVLYDLDVQAQEMCKSLGIGMVRAGTVGTHPRFVQMLRELVVERLSDQPVRLALGDRGPSPDNCDLDCCRYSPRGSGPRFRSLGTAATASRGRSAVGSRLGAGRFGKLANPARWVYRARRVEEQEGKEL